MYRKKYRYKYNKSRILTWTELIFVIGVLGYSTHYIKNEKYILLIIVVISIVSIYFLGSLTKKIYIKYKKKRDYLCSDIRAIDRMSGIEFEEYLKVHFETKGYSAKLTPATNDYGADLVIKKGKETIVVQAKRYKEKVSNKAVQEVAGAKGYYNASKGIVITNSFFTKNAIELAKSCNIELWDRNKLIEIFKVKNEITQ